MKRIVALLLALAMTLGAAGAFAGENYIPGAHSNRLLLDAFLAGKHVGMHAGYDVALDAEANGLTQAQAELVTKLISEMRVEYGAVKIDDGIRVDAAITVYGETVDAMLDLTREGVALRSQRLMPGVQVTARWETLLKQAGMNPTYADQIPALLQADWEALLPQLMAQAEQLAAQAVAAAQPYAQTIGAFMERLEPETVTRVPQAEGYPLAARQVIYTITDRDAGRLLLSLVAVLEQDETALPLITALVGQASGEGCTEDELLAELRALINANFTDEQRPLRVTIGYAQGGEVLYVQMNKAVSDTQNASLFAGETDGQGEVRLAAGVAQADSSAFDAGLEIVAAQRDAADGAKQIAFALDVYGGGASVAALAVDATQTPYSAEGGLPGMRQTVALTARYPGFDLVMAVDSDACLTADGGESITVNTTADQTMNGQRLPISATARQITTPGANGDVAAAGIEQMDMSAMGIERMTFAYAIAAQDYAQPAPAERILALEESDQAALDALMETVQAHAKEIADAVEGKIGEVIGVEMEMEVPAA